MTPKEILDLVESMLRQMGLENVVRVPEGVAVIGLGAAPHVIVQAHHFTLELTR